MAGPITAKYRLAMKLFGDYHREIIRLLTKEKQNANEADDADLIGTYDWTALLKPARDDLAAHIARKDNPHQETIETQDSYSIATINAKLAGKVPNSVLPISTYGIIDELSSAQVDALWTAAGWVLTCGAYFKVSLGGTFFRMPPSQLNLATADPAPANKTFNIYARIQFGYISYQARADSPPESESVIFIGRATTGPSGIVSKQFFAVQRIETFRLSSSPVGSAIPYVAGSYDSPTKLSAAWRPL